MDLGFGAWSETFVHLPQSILGVPWLPESCFLPEATATDLAYLPALSARVDVEQFFGKVDILPARSRVTHGGKAAANPSKGSTVMFIHIAQIRLKTPPCRFNSGPHPPFSLLAQCSRGCPGHGREWICTGRGPVFKEECPFFIFRP